MATINHDMRLAAANKMPRDRSIFDQMIIENGLDNPLIMQADRASRKRQAELIAKEQAELAAV